MRYAINQQDITQPPVFPLTPSNMCNPPHLHPNEERSTGTDQQ